MPAVNHTHSRAPNGPDTHKQTHHNLAGRPEQAPLQLPSPKRVGTAQSIQVMLQECAAHAALRPCWRTTSCWPPGCTTGPSCAGTATGAGAAALTLTMRLLSPSTISATQYTGCAAARAGLSSCCCSTRPSWWEDPTGGLRIGLPPLPPGRG